MKRCRHRSTRHMRWTGEAWELAARGINCAGWIAPSHGAVVCNACGAWLSLGPSDETPVAVEVLAAFLANPGGFASVAHKDHHNMEWIDQDFGYAFREDCDGCQGEYLALVIATHGEDQ